LPALLSVSSRIPWRVKGERATSDVAQRVRRIENPLPDKVADIMKKQASERQALEIFAEAYPPRVFAERPPQAAQRPGQRVREMAGPQSERSELRVGGEDADCRDR